MPNVPAQLVGDIDKSKLKFLLMTNDEKKDLARQVKFRIALKETDSEIIARLNKRGYKKATIKKYIKSFKSKQ